MSADERLNYCQLVEQGVEDRRAYAVSLTATRCGDGECSDFGIFTITHGTLPEDDPSKAAKAAGHVARTISTTIMRQYYHDTLNDVDPLDLPDISAVLSEAIQTANNEIKEQYAEARVGITTLLVLDNRLFLTNIGKGSAFVMSDDGLQRLTSDTPSDAPLLGDPDREPQADVVIKYLQPHSELLVTSLDVWGLEQLENTVKASAGLGPLCSAMKLIIPPEYSADIAIVGIKLGYLQQ